MAEGFYTIVIPDLTTNLVPNPSFEEDVRGWTIVSGARTIEEQQYGAYSVNISGAADIYTDTIELTASGNYVVASCYIFSSGTQYLRIYDVDSAAFVATTTLEGDGDWQRLITSGAVVGDEVRLYVGGDPGYFLDAVQLEEKNYVTTFADGSRPQCYWGGEKNYSKSIRSERAALGGREINLDGYDLYIEAVQGIGMPPVTNNVYNRALLPGQTFSNTKINERVIQLVLWTDSHSQSALHQIRQDLLNAIKPDRSNENTPLILKYAGSGEELMTRVRYEAGLEFTGQTGFTENIPLRLIGLDPFWYEDEDEADALDTQNTGYFQNVCIRPREDAQWFGPPVAGGIYLSTECFAEDDTYIYIGGNFTNFNNIANADYIARYHKEDGVWSALNTGMDDVVRDILVAPDGAVYACGNFLNAGGNAANRIAKWDGTDWSALGTGLDNIGRGMVFAGGYLYVVGSFQNAGGGAAKRVAKWSGAAWSAVGAGLNSTAYCIAKDRAENLYIGGNFTDVDGGPIGTYNRIIKWNGSSYSALGTGMNNRVDCVAVGLDQTVFAGGMFTTAGGVTVNYIAQWNGFSWSDLEGGAEDDVDTMSVGPDGLLWVGGEFTYIGDTGTVNTPAAIWNGYVWQQLDFAIPVVITPVHAIYASQFTDPLTGAYDVFYSPQTNDFGDFSGVITVDNEGTATTYPQIVIKPAASGTTLYYIQNHTTGDKLLFNMDLFKDETLTIDLAEKTITSDYRGNALRYLRDGSDFADFGLLPGENIISVFLYNPDDEDVEAYIKWVNTYWSAD